MEETYKVLVRTDDVGRIVEINSSVFVADTTGWVQIDVGAGDKYHHAQGNYFALPLIDERGVYRYKLADGKAAARTVAEMDADVPVVVPMPTDAERIAALEAAVLAMMEVTA